MKKKQHTQVIKGVYLQNYLINNCPRVPNLHQINATRDVFHSVVGYADYLFNIFINIETLEIREKITKTLRGVPSKLPISRQLIILR